FTPEERKRLEMTAEKFPIAVTPYYASLIDRENWRDDPVFRQAFPSVNELVTESWEMSDPLSEDEDSPAECITHRYPDRVLFHVSNMCAVYCRHCTRKRKVGDRDFIPGRDTLEKGLAYIRKTPK
ncbi:MAG: lysine 2,3-aminomutase, partial [Geovibrio sp.]|nr:lysine 2,3-aminomutase [Geovibrio sp.]